MSPSRAAARIATVTAASSTTGTRAAVISARHYATIGARPSSPSSRSTAIRSHLHLAFPPGVPSNHLRAMSTSTTDHEHMLALVRRMIPPLSPKLHKGQAGKSDRAVWYCTCQTPWSDNGDMSPRPSYTSSPTALVHVLVGRVVSHSPVSPLCVAPGRRTAARGCIHHMPPPP